MVVRPDCRFPFAERLPSESDLGGILLGFIASTRRSAPKETRPRLMAVVIATAAFFGTSSFAAAAPEQGE